MDLKTTAETSLLIRSLKVSWLVALALVAALLPSHPLAAVSLAAGQVIAALNFFFIEKLVKLFTQSSISTNEGHGKGLDGGFFVFLGLKVAIVYGGLIALVLSRSVELVPLAFGFSIPLLTLFLKSIMSAFGSGSGSWVRRATKTAATSGDAAKPAALLLFAGLLTALLFAPSISVAQETHGQPPAHGEAATPPAHGDAPATAHGEAAQGEHKASSGVQHLPNWVILLNDYFPNNPVVHWMHENEYLVFAWLAGIIFLVVTWVAMRRPKPVPGHLQNALEWMVESMENVCGGLLGKHAKRYMPFVFALFFYILTMNLLGIIPGFMSATSSLDLTLALAIVTFLFVQFSGVQNLGFVGYLDHLAGSPRDAIGWAMLPVMLPVHILGELAKPVSLSCRLFGNIFGEDTLIVVFVGATALCLKASLTALAVPPLLGISALFMMLQTLTAIVQALIFALLATVYLYMMLPHESHAHGEAEAAH